MKPVIYQLLPRLFSNQCGNPVPCGTMERNGCGKFNGITSSALRAIKSLGATHVWFTGVIEHAHCPDYSAWGITQNNCHVVKGQAGSPYAITDYYDVDPDLAENPANRMAEFDALIERTHRQGLKALIDFVPNHVAREYHSDAAPRGVRDLGADDRTDVEFHPDNNFYYMPGTRFSPHNVYLGDYVEEPARASGNDCFTPSPDRNDWYETVKLNYGIDYRGGTGAHFDPVPSTWRKMVHILRYWARKGVDGFRCDMAHMVPIEFWAWAIPQVRKVNRRIIFIAEIYDVNLYRPYIFDGGFDYLYDKVNLYDTLRGIQCHGVSASALTGCWQRVEGIGDHMLNFLENHDEQRYASAFYAGRADTVLPSLVVSALIGTGAEMIYFGQELGETGMEAEGFSGLDGRTTIFDYWSVPTVRQWLSGGKPSMAGLSAAQVSLRNMYRTVLRLCNDCPAISEGRFFDLMYANYENPRFDSSRQFAFMRHHGDCTLLIVANFSEYDAEVAVNIPRHAFDCLGVAEGEYRAKELLGGRRKTHTLSSAIPFVTPVAAHGAVVWAF